MLINYNLKDLDKLSADFFNATGVDLDILDENLTLLKQNPTNSNPYCNLIQTSKKGKKDCRFSDDMIIKKCKETGEPQMHMCHAGLIDVAIPIKHEDIIIGYIVLGQIKNHKDFSSIVHKVVGSPISLKKLEKCYNELKFFDVDRIRSVVTIAMILAKHILLDNIITLKSNKNIERVVSYINDNLETNLTVSKIAEAVNLSKSTLYSILNNHFNCTVNEYINRKRVEKSMKLLMDTDLTVDEIAQKSGFSSMSYYSKTFKKIHGVSPLKFRKHQHFLK